MHRERFGGHSKEQKEKGEHKGEGLMEKVKHAVGMDRKEKTPTPEPGK